MNRSDLRARVRSLTNVYSSALLSDADINGYLSDAHYRLCAVHDWPFLVQTISDSLVAGQPVVDLPSDVGKVLAVSAWEANGTRQPLTPVTDWELGTLVDVSGMPSGYRFVPGENPYVEVTPTPTSGVQVAVVYVGTPDAFDSDVAEPPFAVEFHPVYAYVAAVQALADRNADERKQQALGQTAAGFVDRMRRLYVAASDRTPVNAGRNRWRRASRWRA